jgi:periplasmic protein CpxP/Spy
MTRSKTSSLTIAFTAVAFSTLALAGGALAQTSPSTAQSAAAPQSGPALPKAMSVKMEQHIRLLHQQLKITSAEQPKWDQFADVMRDNAAQIEQALATRSANMPAMSAVDNMQSYAHLAQVHATNMQNLASAFQSLYNSFPASQKLIADQVFQANGGKPLPSHD